MNGDNTMPIRSRRSAVGCVTLASVLAMGCVTLASVLAMVVAAGVGDASAGRIDPPGHGDANHCLNEFDVDLNELYGITDQFRNRDCQVVSAGEHWVPGPLAWVVNTGAGIVYPPGYTPSELEPIEIGRASCREGVWT